MGCTPPTFSRMSCDRLSTMVSSCELFFGAVGVVEGRTIVVDFFGLSSSLKENHLSSRIGEDHEAHEGIHGQEGIDCRRGKRGTSPGIPPTVKE
jgi:hypothetical protein